MSGTLPFDLVLGDVVKLRTGSPNMTVTCIYENDLDADPDTPQWLAKCEWFASEHTDAASFCKEFPPEALIVTHRMPRRAAPPSNGGKKPAHKATEKVST